MRASPIWMSMCWVNLPGSVGLVAGGVRVVSRGPRAGNLIINLFNGEKYAESFFGLRGWTQDSGPSVGRRFHRDGERAAERQFLASGQGSVCPPGRSSEIGRAHV